MTAIIYALRDPRTNEVRYIGKTANIKQRMNSHRSTASEGNAQFFTRRDVWLHELYAAGLEPLVAVVESVEGDDWRTVERRWIEHYRAQGADLTNGMLCRGWSDIAWENNHRRKAYWAKQRAAGLA